MNERDVYNHRHRTDKTYIGAINRAATMGGEPDIKILKHTDYPWVCSSYLHLAAYTKGGRKKVYRPLNHWLTANLTEDPLNEEPYIRITIRNSPYSGDATDILATVHPNDTIKFLIPAVHMPSIRSSMKGNFCKILPFRFEAKAYDTTYIDHLLPIATELGLERLGEQSWGVLRNQNLGGVMRNSPVYHCGVEFDLITGACINRCPMMESFEEDVSVRKDWRRDLRHFKIGIRSRAAIGAFEPYLAQAYADRDTRLGRRTIKWGTRENLELIITAIKTREVPEILMTRLALTAVTERQQYRLNVDPVGAIMSVVDGICTDYSISLRRCYGVFKGSLPTHWG